MTHAVSSTDGLSTRDTAGGGGLPARVLGLLVLVFAPFLVFWPSTAALAVRWTDTVHRTYTHGYVVLLLAAWMIWRDRSVLVRVAARPSHSALGVLLLLVLMWLVASAAGLQIVHQGLLPLMSAAGVAAVYGLPAARRLILPVGYLYFAIPVWDAVNGLLQTVSVRAVQVLLGMAGVPAHFVGNTFQIPEGAFEIADGCSGLHFMIVALSIGVLLGEVNRDSWRLRVVLVLLAGLLAALTNWLRIFVIVMAGHLTDMQHSLITDEHYNFGWMMFAGMMVVFFIIARFLPDSTSAVPFASGASPARPSQEPRVALAVTLLCLLMASAWAFFVVRGDAAERVSYALDVREGAWSRSEPSASDWQPVFSGADAEIRSRFVTGGQAIDAYAAVYAFQRQGKEVNGYGNSALGDSLTAASGLGAAELKHWREQRARDATGREWLLWSTYQIGDAFHGDALRAQLAYGLRALAGPPRSAVVLLRAPCEAECDTARGHLVDLGGRLAVHEASLPSSTSN